MADQRSHVTAPPRVNIHTPRLPSEGEGESRTALICFGSSSCLPR